MLKSIQINEDLNPPDKDNKISETYQNLAQAYIKGEQYEEAVDLLEKAVQVCMKYESNVSSLPVFFFWWRYPVGKI